MALIQRKGPAARAHGHGLLVQYDLRNHPLRGDDSDGGARGCNCFTSRGWIPLLQRWSSLGLVIEACVIDP